MRFKMLLRRLKSLGILGGLGALGVLGGSSAQARESTLSDAQLCARCHPEVAAQWERSAHRHSSFTNPYYAFAANDLHQRHGESKFRFCARCHDPALISRSERGAELNEPIDLMSPKREVGIDCNLCHSIAQSPDPRGNALYQLDLAPFQPPGHSHQARFAPPHLRTSTLCASCHKVSLSPSFTQDRWQRGQDDADVWSQSVYAGGEPLLPLALFHQASDTSDQASDTSDHTSDQASDTSCQTCHMPYVSASSRERGAREGRVRDHRFWSANASLLNLRGDLEGVRSLARGLQGLIELGLHTVRFNELEPYQDSDQKPIPRVLEVSLMNRGVGHRFPGGVNDTNEVWLELSAWDTEGHLVATSGVLPEEKRVLSSLQSALSAPIASPLTLTYSDADLPPLTHLIRAQAVDLSGSPLQHRDVTRHASVLYDTSLHPYEPRIVRYLLPPQTRHVKVRLRMRQFEAYYARESCALLMKSVQSSRRCVTQPVLTLAQNLLTWGDQDTPQDTEELNHLWGLTSGLTSDLSRVEAQLKAPWEVFISPLQHHLLMITVARALGQTNRVIMLNRRAFTRSLADTSTDHSRLLWSLWTETQALTEAFRSREALPIAQELRQRRTHDWKIGALLARLLGENQRFSESFVLTQDLLNQNSEYADFWRLQALALRGLRDPKKRPLIEHADREWDRYRVDQERQSALRRAASYGSLAPRLQAIPTYLLTQ